MKRKTFEERTGEAIEIDTNYNSSSFCVNKLQKFLRKAKTEGCTHLDITGDCWDGCLDSITIESVKVFTESDEDYDERIRLTRVENLKELNEAKIKERALYESLKLKYDNLNQ